jgi:P-type conjugative transfer protein TrbJ
MMAPAHAAGIPVFDAGNLTQNVMTAMESVAQTLQQIEQYRTQLQQYENMLRNTAAPAAYIWDQAVTTMNLLRGAIDTLNYYKANLGSIDNYLGKFQDVAYYRSSPCFNGLAVARRGTGRDQGEASASESEAQKRATDALFKGLDRSRTRCKPMRAPCSASSRVRRRDRPDAGHRLRQPARQPAGQPVLQIRAS